MMGWAGAIEARLRARPGTVPCVRVAPELVSPRPRDRMLIRRPPEKNRARPASTYEKLLRESEEAALGRCTYQKPGFD